MSAGSESREDRYWSRQAVALAALGEGSTRPNPRVGCVVVRDGTLVAAGYHIAPGLPHAEAEALRRAGDAARGATLYVNLEPCSHHGRTPPCADRIVESGVRRVVAAIQDPNPLVDGRGFRVLRGAGIEVVVGPSAAESRRINEPFLRWYGETRPAITLKAGLTVDGRLSAAAGNSRWITGEPARRFAHRLRLAHDAVLVGAGTLRNDDPSLDVRLPGVPAGGPLPVVLSSSARLDPSARLFARPAGHRPRVYVPREVEARAEALAGVADVVRVGSTGGGLNLDEVLSDLARSGVQSLLVEGGGKTHGAFLESGRVDRLALFQASRFVGAHGATPLFDLDAVAAPARGWTLDEVRRIPLGDDVVLLGRPAGPTDGATGGG